MYRTFLEDVWLSDIGRMAEVRNVPHVARNVWLRGNDTYYIYGIYYENKLPTHTLRATCGTLLSNENEHLTHTLQARCGTFTLLQSEKPPKPRALTNCQP